MQQAVSGQPSATAPEIESAFLFPFAFFLCLFFYRLHDSLRLTTFPHASRTPIPHQRGAGTCTSTFNGGR